MNFVIIEKNNNNVPSEHQLEAALKAVGGTPVASEGSPASRKVTFTGEVNHTDFENELINTVPRSRRTSWSFVWGDALQTSLISLGGKPVVSHTDYAQALNAILQATRKSVKIQIAPGDLETLKNAEYKLCFAKKVGDNAYNVVWQAYGKYAFTTSFSWVPQYQLFGTNSFDASVQVDVSTNLVDIGLGETSVLNKVGTLEEPRTGGKSTAITMINNYDTIHPGVNQVSTGVDGKLVSTPIYVATEEVVKGTVELEPVEKVLVWFEQKIQTSTMFSSSRSQSVEIDLTKNDNAVRLYSDGKWSTP
ncbi:hypothetical protein [Pseudomonas sp. PAMC 26793]|uniref:hypothetical protein n=1 Tax=Pseudomonas sp. PAMC 26793 TaxID=1240676 RepID=UPI00210CF762|nr:hypothetical protein [Pseudomonas sp. PAMC 26793]